MYYTGFFLTGAPLKVISVRLHSKSHQKSSKCQNLLTEKKLVIFRGHQLKKHTVLSVNYQLARDQLYWQYRDPDIQGFESRYDKI